MLKAISSLNITVADARQNSDTQKLEEDLTVPSTMLMCHTRWCGKVGPNFEEKKGKKEERILLNFASIKSQSTVVRIIWSRDVQGVSQAPSAKRNGAVCSEVSDELDLFLFF